MEKKQVNHSAVAWGLFIIITLVQLGFIIYDFQVNKEGVHSDEMWSYGFANSYYQAHIFMDDNEQLINDNAWIDGQVLRDYVTVQDGEQFAYDSVLCNQKEDLSPPFHSLVLHTISSFFPGVYHRWFSFSINVMAFLLTQVLLFVLLKRMKGNVLAILVCGAYGFSLAARDTFIYLRPYALCTALTMVIVYYSYLFYKEESRTSYKKLAIIAFSSFLAFFSNMYMIAYIGVFTFFLCFILLCHRRVKHTFLYGFTMLGTLIGLLLSYPSMLDVFMTRTDSFYSGELDFSFAIRLKVMIGFITQKILGINYSVYDTGIMPIVCGVCVVGFIISLPLIIWLRNAKYILYVRNCIKSICLSPIKTIHAWMKKIDWFCVVILCSIIVQCIIVQGSADLYGMGAYADRYIMYLYPLAFLIILSIIYAMTIRIVKKWYVMKLVCGVLLFGFIILGHYNKQAHTIYYFKQFVEVNKISEAVSEKSCIILNNDYWELVLMLEELQNVRTFFSTDSFRFQTHRDAYLEKIQQEKVIVMIDCSNFVDAKNQLEGVVEGNIHFNIDENIESNRISLEEAVQFFEELVPETTMKKVAYAYLYGREMLCYEINP